jgi:hypothetical protein
LNSPAPPGNTAETGGESPAAASDRASTDPATNPLMVGIATARPADTPESLQQKRETIAASIQEADAAGERGEIDAAVEILRKTVNLDAENRDVLLRLAGYLRQSSRAIWSDDAYRSYQLIVEASTYLRVMLTVHHEFTDEERLRMAEVFFDEACGQARSNRWEEFTTAINDAVGFGFSDLERLKSDPDLAAFWNVPQMSQVLEGAASNIETRRAPAAEPERPVAQPAN